MDGGEILGIVYAANCTQLMLKILNEVRKSVHLLNQSLDLPNLMPSNFDLGHGSTA